MAQTFQFNFGNRCVFLRQSKCKIFKTILYRNNEYNDNGIFIVATTWFFCLFNYYRFCHRPLRRAIFNKYSIHALIFWFKLYFYCNIVCYADFDIFSTSSLYGKCLNEYITEQLNGFKTHSVSEVRRILHIFRKMVDFIETFNKIFGWLLFTFQARLYTQS